MSVWDRAAEALRGHWEAAMTDACTVASYTAGQGTYDDTTHTYTPPAGSSIYVGECLVVPRTMAPAQVGQERQELADVDVYVPHNTTGLQVHQLLTITTAPLATHLEGMTLHVIEVEPLARNARTRLGCTTNLGGGVL